VTWGAEAPFVRPLELSAPHVRADDVLRFSLAELERQGESPEIIVPLESTYPFRPESLLDTLIERLLLDDFDTVIAGFSEYRPCWCHAEGELVRLDAHEQVRRDRDPVIIGLLSLGCATYPDVIRRGSRLGERIGVYEVRDPIAAIEIRDPADLKLMETLQHVVPQWRSMLRRAPVLVGGGAR
jgi:N-acylneuraminate cytidylyltransferase